MRWIERKEVNKCDINNGSSVLLDNVKSNIHVIWYSVLGCLWHQNYKCHVLVVA